MPQEPARIGIIGTGWRADAYARIAAARPDLFKVYAALTRSAPSAQTFQRAWGVPTFTVADEFFAASSYDFVVVCVPRTIAPDWVLALDARRIAALLETPPASDLDGLIALRESLSATSRVQVAEQYQFQPHHAARISIARSGLIGSPQYARASVTHDYHAISLLRALLGVGFEPVEISATAFGERVSTTIGRDGWSDSGSVRVVPRVTARLSFRGGDVIADYDFGEELYFSRIRSRHIVVSGELGEVFDDSVRYLRGAADAVQVSLNREVTGVDGDLEGSHLRAISLGEREVYVNPLAPARLSDDEVAIGTVLMHMTEYARGGKEFYSLDDASHDHYLGLLIAQAVSTGRVVVSKEQPWANPQR